MEPPALGRREDLAYRVFPREMTVPVELSMRRTYLSISRRLIQKRFGDLTAKEPRLVPAALRRRVERDLLEYDALSRKPPRR
jgi:hypothetical protein